MAQLSISFLTDHVIESLATPPTVVHIANTFRAAPPTMEGWLQRYPSAQYARY